ncbi:short-chain dehydrogenase/reductase [Gracilaria domingensis]|nr:short-chain dehydrogenase/reductase [Gracilaria domingensis]
MITGCSSGIGFDTAKHFAEKEWNVVATMRKPSCEAGQSLAKVANIEVQPLDVTDIDSIKATVHFTVEKFGSIDAIVNNAGYGLVGPVEIMTPEQVDRQYKTNVYGPVYVMQAVLPQMRKQKSGVIVNITSVGGRLVMPFASLYHGTKWALEGITESMAFELEPFGIRVRLVEPGHVETNFASTSMAFASSETVKVYDKMVEKAFSQVMTEDTAAGSKPAKIAAVIYEAAVDDTNKLRYPAGDDAHVMLSKRAAVTDEEFQKLTVDRFKFASVLEEA